jgi:hypothetical protein
MQVFRKLETQTGNGLPSLLQVSLYARINTDWQIWSDSFQTYEVSSHPSS